MPRTKVITDLEQMRLQAFTPPFALMGFLEEAEIRGQKWRVVMAYGSISGEARWVAEFPGTRESLFFNQGDQLQGRWIPEHQVFVSEEGPVLNLLGNPVSLSSLEEAAEEEDVGDE